MMATPTAAWPTNAAPQPPRARVAAQFAIAGDLRFISHHDELRLLARALTRARWPVAYSRGFNPQPRVVLPLPRSVGTASACQWALVELNESRPAEQLQQSLAVVLPPAYRLTRVVTLTTRAKPHPRRALYAVELQPEHVAQTCQRIAELLTAETCTIERSYAPGKPARAIDIRPYIENVTLSDRTLSARLTFQGQRSARPGEVLTALALPPGEYAHRVRRVAVDWNIELASPTVSPASAERNNVGQEKTFNGQPQEPEKQATS